MTTAVLPNAKPVRRRAYAPKVRTGCFSWIRRKKCDETKPACRRCVESGFTCDGYPSACPPDASLKRPARGSREANASGRTDRTAVHLPSPSAELSLDPQPSLGTLRDPHFFHHFRAIAVPDFIRMVSPGNFWTTHVLPLCHTEPAVLYAATALGAAHNLYLAGGGRGHPNDQRWLGHATITHYNHSIGKILDRGRFFTGDSRRLGPLLVCCILFVCLENLLGRNQESLRHMRAGAALLTAIDLTPPCPRAPGPAQSPRIVGHAALPALLQSSATVLSRFGIDASILQGQQLIPDIRPYAAMPRPLGDSARPFASLQDAKETIWDLDARMVWLERPWPPEDADSFDLPTCTSTPDEGLMRPSPAWERLEADFRRWSSKLNHTMAANIHAQTPSPELRERLMMSLRQRMWDMIMADDSKIPMICDMTLRTIEHVYEVEQVLAPRPVFTLDCDTIPLLLMIAAEDKALTPRIVALLRKYQRREGTWDSAQVADNIETWPREVLEQMSFRWTPEPGSGGPAQLIP